MKVQNKRNIRLVRLNLFNQMVDYRTDHFARPFPTPIGIEANEFSPAIAMNDTIHIGHGYNLKHIIMQLRERSIES